jgi:hypothetical protein
MHMLKLELVLLHLAGYIHQVECLACWLHKLVCCHAVVKLTASFLVLPFLLLQVSSGSYSVLFVRLLHCFVLALALL